MDERLSRRSFLIKGSLFIASASAMGGAFSCTSRGAGNRASITGGIAGADWRSGHRLIAPEDIAPEETEQTGIVIVGGGIAGLSAARELQKQRFSDFLLLELGSKTGGNASCGRNPVSAFPWGAHYIPIPGEEAVFVRELFEELGIIEGHGRDGLPVYNEFYLCASPQERLLIHGHWQEGLVPQLGISDRDRRQYTEFFRAMERFRTAKGSDGRRAFSVPLELSSHDGKFTRLDAISMERYLFENGWDSEYLRWYVNYCCRDDYGCSASDTSAWAGIHYFASRAGKAENADSHTVVTWPEGVGWIVEKLESKMKGHIRCGCCVLNIEEGGGGYNNVDCYDAGKGRAVRIRAKAVIYAAPRFTAFRTVRAFRETLPDYAGSFAYAPWMVANITVKEVPEGAGAPLSWDNVSYNSDSLGYILANHQDIALRRGKSVLTYYLPLTGTDPVLERKEALGRSYQKWREIVIGDLSRMHPGIENLIEELNVWLWGHAMLRPVPGFIWGAARRKALAPFGNVFFAHSDMSGISIFEEAQYRGIMAAKAAVRKV